jgi:hypothetical protein
VAVSKGPAGEREAVLTEEEGDYLHFIPPQHWRSYGDEDYRGCTQAIKYINAKTTKICSRPGV